MKTLKKVMTVLSLCLICFNSNVFALYTGNVKDYDFVMNSDGENTITLTKYKGTSVINYFPDEIDETQRDQNTNRDVVIKRYYPTRIANTTYQDKKKLRDKIDILDNYVEIESATFKGAQNVQRGMIGVGIKKIPSECFSSAVNLKTVTGLKNVTSIDDEAFRGCTVLNSITLTDKLTNIGARAFYDCGELEISIFPDTITNIGDEAFAKCSKLSFSNLPSSVKTIGDRAFLNTKCSKTSITLPNELQSVGSEAFAGVSLKYVKVMGDNLPTIQPDTFDPSVTIVFPLGTKAKGTYINKGYGGYNIVEINYGDVNNDSIVNSTDAAMVLDMYKNDTPPEDETDMLKCDLDGNNIINSTDAAMILDIYKNN